MLPTFARSFFRLALVCVVLGQTATLSAQLPTYTLFESDPVTPMAMSQDGTRLYAVNTPDGRLEVFEPTSAGRLTLSASSPLPSPSETAARSGWSTTCPIA
jgi:6-phosphogluconolactonase (cycloisomerase 2 family)